MFGAIGPRDLSGSRVIAARRSTRAALGGIRLDGAGQRPAFNDSLYAELSKARHGECRRNGVKDVYLIGDAEAPTSHADGPFSTVQRLASEIEAAKGAAAAAV